MCKTNMKTNFYYANICKHKYGKNMIKLWCKIMFKTNVEQTKKNERSYFYLYPFEEASKETFWKLS
jgi:hypothetical protein